MTMTTAMRSSTRIRMQKQAGAALLAAMLTVTLVATYAASAMWQQWRSIEVEAAERARIQAAWILVGALDWSRLILREDALSPNSDGTDNLTEPWSIPLEEARLSTFLAAQRGVAQNQDASADTENAFLSGRITDMQSRMNLRNLVGSDKTTDPAVLKRFQRLFTYLNLPPQDLEIIARNIVQAQTPLTADNQNAPLALMPQDVSQLTWWGVAPDTAAKLAPYVTILPVSTKVNLNTAPAEVIWASTESLSMSEAQRLVQSRESRYFKKETDASRLVSDPEQISTTFFTVSSSYYEVRGRMRIEQTVVEERSLVFKQAARVRTLWRQRGGFLRDSADALGKS